MKLGSHCLTKYCISGTYIGNCCRQVYQFERDEIILITILILYSLRFSLVVVLSQLYSWFYKHNNIVLLNNRAAMFYSSNSAQFLFQ